MGWFFATIVVPLLAPLCVSLLFNFLPISNEDRSRMHPLNAIKDGQLCWIALAFSASGLYELYGAVDSPWIFGLLLLTLVASSLLASCGALFQTSLRHCANERWFMHFRCLIASLVLTGGAATLFTLAHFQI